MRRNEPVIAYCTDSEDFPIKLSLVSLDSIAHGSVEKTTNVRSHFTFIYSNVKIFTQVKQLHSCKDTVTSSLVLSWWNLTPTRTPAITIATTSAHVTPMITCFRVARDFFAVSSTWIFYYRVNS